MGARVSRLFRNFNLEARAHREIGKSKPQAAPRHRTSALQDNSQSAAASEANEIHRRDDPLLSRLRHVYVQSTDPQSQNSTDQRKWTEHVERRPVSTYASAVPPGMCEITDVPKGKLTLVEALMALNNHKRSPGTWPAEKIAQELALRPDDARSLISYFIPFEIKLLPPRSENQRIGDS